MQVLPYLMGNEIIINTPPYLIRANRFFEELYIHKSASGELRLHTIYTWIPTYFVSKMGASQIIFIYFVFDVN